MLFGIVDSQLFWGRQVVDRTLHSRRSKSAAWSSLRVGIEICFQFVDLLALTAD